MCSSTLYRYKYILQFDDQIVPSNFYLKLANSLDSADNKFKLGSVVSYTCTMYVNPGEKDVSVGTKVMSVALLFLEGVFLFFFQYFISTGFFSLLVLYATPDSLGLDYWGT